MDERDRATARAWIEAPGDEAVADEDRIDWMVGSLATAFATVREEGRREGIEAAAFDLRACFDAARALVAKLRAVAQWAGLRARLAALSTEMWAETRHAGASCCELTTRRWVEALDVLLTEEPKT